MQKCVHVFLLPAIRSIVIPGEDPESKVHSHNYIHSLSHGPKRPQDFAFHLKALEQWKDKMEHRFYVKAKGVSPIIGKYFAHQERKLDFDKPVPWLKIGKRTLKEGSL